VGWVGRLSGEKGPDLLLDALARINRPDITTVLLGDGPDRAALERRVAEGVLRSSVRFVGGQVQAARLFSAFDVLAISSRTEGLPMVMLEAVAAHVPVVAFAVGGIPEVLDHATGWLAPPGDCDTLGRHLAAACDDIPGRSTRALEAARRSADLLATESWMEAVERVYAGITAPRDVSASP
jgi:glycosyltransferase involved in cell wall biosynthesis